MKKEEMPRTCDQKPKPVDLDARYKGIGISAVAAAVRYNHPVCCDNAAADKPREHDARPRSAA